MKQRFILDVRWNTESDKTRIHTQNIFFRLQTSTWLCFALILIFIYYFFSAFLLSLKSFSIHQKPDHEQKVSHSGLSLFFLAWFSSVFGGCLRFIFFVVAACWGNRLCLSYFCPIDSITFAVSAYHNDSSSIPVSDSGECLNSKIKFCEWERKRQRIENDAK